MLDERKTHNRKYGDLEQLWIIPKTGKNSISSLNSTPLSCLMEGKPLMEACKQREAVQRVIFLDRAAVRGELQYPFSGIKLPQQGF